MLSRDMRKNIGPQPLLQQKLMLLGVLSERVQLYPA